MVLAVFNISTSYITKNTLVKERILKMVLRALGWNGCKFIVLMSFCLFVNLVQLQRHC